MIHTIYDILFSHRLYGLLHEYPVIILDDAGDFWARSTRKALLIFENTDSIGL